jgi:SRSO17 transposase
MAARFPRVETRRRAGKLVLGLLADLPRKNCWSIAEHAGDRDPHGMQYLLSRASWDTDGVRDDLRDYVVGQLGDTDGVLVFDETGDLKKGTGTVGVQRQYTGTAGRIENAQVAVYLTYAATRGHALIDRELYLPQSWTSDPDTRMPTLISRRMRSHGHLHRSRDPQGVPVQERPLHLRVARGKAHADLVTAGPRAADAARR